MGLFDTYDPTGAKKQAADAAAAAAATKAGTGGTTDGGAAQTQQTPPPTGQDNGQSSAPTGFFGLFNKGVTGSDIWPAAKPGPQSWGDIFTHTYSADPTDPQLYKDVAAKFGQGLAYDLGPQALRGAQKVGLDAPMSPEDLQKAQDEAANRLGPMSPIIKGAGYYVSPITKLVGAPLGAVVGAGAARIAGPLADAAAPYVPKAVSAAADYLPEGAANWLKNYAGQLPSSIPNAATQSTLTSALSGYGNAPTLDDYKAGGRAAWDAVTNPMTYAGGLIPGGRRMLPGDARTQAQDLMGDTQYGGYGVDRILKQAADTAREDVTGKGGSSGIEGKAAPDVTNLVETLHWGMPTNAKDIQNVIDEVNAKGSTTQSPTERKMAEAYSNRLGEVFNEPPISGGNPAQVQSARTIQQMTDQPLTAPQPRNPLADLLGIPSGAVAGGAMHLMHPDIRTSLPVAAAASVWPYAKQGAQKWWNATSKLNALQPEVNTMYSGERVSPNAGNALLNLMLSSSLR